MAKKGSGKASVRAKAAHSAVKSKGGSMKKASAAAGRAAMKG